VRRLANVLDGLTQGDVKAALSRARITLDIPAAESGPIPTAPAPTPAVEADKHVQVAGKGQRSPMSYGVTVKGLLDAGLIRSGTTLRKRYLGQDLLAKVEPDGRIRFGDHLYESLSTAAGAARVAVKGAPPDGRRYYQTNGWTFWECESETGESYSIEVLRQRYLKGATTQTAA
jgi:Restriction Enzyme Adenine Methylase Associated